LKVTISCRPRMYAFSLARELQKAGSLDLLITGFPKFLVERYGVNGKSVRSLLFHELLERASQKVAKTLGGWDPANTLRHDWYDWHASRYLQDSSDIFVGFADNSLFCIRKARSLGIKTILERGSTHRLFQEAIMQDEYKRHGFTLAREDQKLIRRELKEYEECDFISVPTSFAKKTFVEAGFSEAKIIQNSYGVDTDLFRPGSKTDDVFRVIHCGTQSLLKGIPYLLQAFSELALPKSELWMVGSVTQEIRPFLEKYAAPNIIRMGPFSELDLCHYYLQCSVLCLASVVEGFGMVQSQAMACGLPVISTENTAGTDLIQDGKDGFVIPIRNVEAIKEKLLYLYENPDLRAQMGLSARARVVEEFTWSDYGRRTLQAYQGILDSSASSA